MDKRLLVLWFNVKLFMLFIDWPRGEAENTIHGRKKEKRNEKREKRKEANTVLLVSRHFMFHIPVSMLHIQRLCSFLVQQGSLTVGSPRE